MYIWHGLVHPGMPGFITLGTPVHSRVCRTSKPGWSRKVVGSMRISRLVGNKVDLNLVT